MTPSQTLTLAGVPESLHAEAIASLNAAKNLLGASRIGFVYATGPLRIVVTSFEVRQT